MPLAKSARGSATNMNWVAPPGDVFERTLSLPTGSATSQLVLSSKIRASLAQSNGCPQPQVAHRNGCKELLNPPTTDTVGSLSHKSYRISGIAGPGMEIGFGRNLQVKGPVEMSSFTIYIHMYIYIYAHMCILFWLRELEDLFSAEATSSPWKSKPQTKHLSCHMQFSQICCMEQVFWANISSAWTEHPSKTNLE